MAKKPNEINQGRQTDETSDTRDVEPDFRPRDAYGNLRLNNRKPEQGRPRRGRGGRVPNESKQTSHFGKSFLEAVRKNLNGGTFTLD